jgi:hypothetical protein
MQRHDVFTRQQFLATGAAGAAALAAGSEALAQAPAQTQKFHVKPLPREIFIDHGINQETRLETLRGYLTPGSHFFVLQPRPRGYVAAGRAARTQHRTRLGPVGLRVGRPPGRSRDPDAGR